MRGEEHSYATEEFQPFLRFWYYDTPQHVESLKALMFQPFLRFWNGQQSEDGDSVYNVSVSTLLEILDIRPSELLQMVWRDVSTLLEILADGARPGRSASMRRRCFNPS